MPTPTPPATCIDPFTAINGHYAIIEPAPAFAAGMFVKIAAPSAAVSGRYDVPSFESFFAMTKRPIEQRLPFASAGGYAFIEEEFLPLR